MYHPRPENIKAHKSLVNHGFNGFFGHAGVVLQLHAADAQAVIAVTDRADKTADGPDALVIGAQGLNFIGEIEVFGADQDAGESHGAILPPAPKAG